MRATSLRSVTMGATTAFNGTVSCFSCGSNCRNQPTHPATDRIAPKMLTAGAVTRPAQTSARPKAKTTGHAVGAGKRTLSGGVRVEFTSCSEAMPPKLQSKVQGRRSEVKARGDACAPGSLLERDLAHQATGNDLDIFDAFI